jgi:hypothetical protein
MTAHDRLAVGPRVPPSAYLAACGGLLAVALQGADGRLLDRLVSLKTPAGSAEFEHQAREMAIDAREAVLEEAQPDHPSGDDEAEAVPNSTPSERAPEATNNRLGCGQPDSALPRQALLPADVLRPLTADEFLPYRATAAIDPTSAVLGAWRRIEQFMHLALRNLGQIERWPNATSMLNQLQEVGLGPHFVRVADELRRLRNSVVHGGDVEVSSAGALDYIDAAERLADALVMLQAEGRPSRN